MKNIKVLFVSQEITPYLDESEMSVIGRYLPQGIQERGKEIRTFMPKYGCINERRNQLHEVIRLSGMNLIIDDADHPLIIKVASIQSARMQVYFIDNEDYFHRKFVLSDENGEEFPDNDERLIFFARGVLETVKKLRWAPDIVHCHGWITGLVPLYLKRTYKEDPLFSNSKVIYSIYNKEFKKPFKTSFRKKLWIEGVSDEDIDMVKQPTFINLSKLAMKMSDAIIFGSQTIRPELKQYVKSLDKPVLDYQSEENYMDAYSRFYDTILSEEIHDSK
ncbi:MAG: glycogen/starch synthase [Bacteroidales bacterium]|nr:MAG: glycogen/starch synthase [Bacteroidales bacterium]